ncbi:unnamed protein product [Anisakis simplex]|uniref:Elongator complex protein 2 n=1 Tax=Anisakis simplex TaxID=6269 RepID=A0A0M3JJD7_ANISI|nr:unnamed protein product [Anisakis simplex]
MEFQVLQLNLKASQQAHASILLWDTDQWEHRAELIHHHLTVTQLEFSHNDSMLLSVSRDRTFALYGCDSSSDAFDWRLLKASSKTDGVHSRIIWTCSWSSDDRYFATGARDKKVHHLVMTLR